MLDLALAYVDHTLRANRRADGLYHSYNILRLSKADAAASMPLYEMLEGQVAILSSGLLSGDEALALLQEPALQPPLPRRPAQLYSLSRSRTGGLSAQEPGSRRNRLPAWPWLPAWSSAAIARLLDPRRKWRLPLQRFVSQRRGRDRCTAPPACRRELAPLVEAETLAILDLFEATFAHHAFTGRSGTFFAYEGLGSIYWHMVSKLLLAAQENYWWAKAGSAGSATCQDLAGAYYDIRAGIGFNKPPAVYGAFPTDPYSHTPKAQGAKQPGMTGQVKEEILTRLGELGIRVANGGVAFDPLLLRGQEFISQPGQFAYVVLDGQPCSLPLPENALAFTFCQTPIIVVHGPQTGIEVAFVDGRRQVFAGHSLDRAMSEGIFRRDGTIRSVTIFSPVA